MHEYAEIYVFWEIQQRVHHKISHPNQAINKECATLCLAFFFFFKDY